MFLSVEDKKYEIVRGFSQARIEHDIEKIKEIAQRKNLSLLVGSDGVIYLGKECIEAEFTDIVPPVSTELTVENPAE